MYRNPATFWILGLSILVVAAVCGGLIAAFWPQSNTPWAGVLTALSITLLPVLVVTRPFAHLYWDVTNRELRSMLPGRAGAALVRTFRNERFVALQEARLVTFATDAAGSRLVLPRRLRAPHGMHRFQLANGKLELVRVGTADAPSARAEGSH